MVSSDGGYHNKIDAALGLQRLRRFRNPNDYAVYTFSEELDGEVKQAYLGVESFRSAAQQPGCAYIHRGGRSRKRLDDKGAFQQISVHNGWT